MPNGDITPLLLYSKDQFLLATKEIVYPYLTNTIQNMYIESYELPEGDDPIVKFQMALREIPQWNQQVIDFKTNEIVTKFPHFDDLLTALIVANVKVMSSINLSEQRPSVNLKIPDVKDIVHQMYVMMAFSVYNSIQANYDFMDNEFRQVSDALVENSIESAIRRLIPMKDILGCFLSGEQQSQAAPMNDDADSEEEEDGDEEEVSEEDEDELTINHGAPQQPAPYQPAPSSDNPYMGASHSATLGETSFGGVSPPSEPSPPAQSYGSGATHGATLGASHGATLGASHGAAPGAPVLQDPPTYPAPLFSKDEGLRPSLGQ